MSMTIRNATGPADLRATTQARVGAAQRRADGMVPRAADTVTERRDRTGAQSVEDKGWMNQQSRLTDSASRTVLAQTTASMQPVNSTDNSPATSATARGSSDAAAQGAAAYAAMQQSGASSQADATPPPERTLSLSA